MIKIKKILYLDNRKFTPYLLLGLIILGSIFLYKSFMNATALAPYGSVDFPQFYDLSKDFWNKKDIFVLYQKDSTYWFPMWNHLIYILFYPYTLFSIEISKIIWFFSNILFTTLIIYILKKNYNLSFNKTLLLSIIIITSTPFTNTLGNGQIGLFLLVCILFYCYSKKKFKFFFLSVAYIKFSFAPFFLINSLLKKEIDIFYAVIISVLSVIFYCFYIKDFNLIQFINPIIVIYEVNALSVDNFVGVGNTFHLKTLFVNLRIEKYYSLGIIIFSIFCIYCLFRRKYKSNELFLIISIASLFVFYHNLYDFVFLIPIVSYLLSEKKIDVIYLINTFVIFWFFYFVRINQLILGNYFADNLINLVGSILLLISFISLLFKKNSIIKLDH